MASGERDTALATMTECRIKITNFSPFAGTVQLKKFIQSRLGNLSFRKLKFAGRTVFVTLDSEECAERAIHLLDNAIYKKNCLRVTKATDLPNNKCQENDSVGYIDETEKSCRKLVTPLFEVPYEEQLKIKLDKSKEVLAFLRQKLAQANAAHSLVAKDTLPRNVLPSPLVEGYRNKCEFSVGFSSGDRSSLVVGFMSGKMASRQCTVLALDDCSNLSANTRSIVRHFEAFVQRFGEEPFDEFGRVGFWKMLTVKDFSGDTMVIVTVHPHPNREVSDKAKTMLTELFLPSHLFCDEAAQFNVTSFYWQEQANAGDERIYEHVAGPPFVYESLLGLTFRISPSTFFQVNTRATEILYETIGNLLGLPTEQKKEMEKEESEHFSKRPFVVLDVCCGAGTISLCLMQRIRKAIRSFPFAAQIAFGCVGIELNREAVRDARKNASENGFDAKSCVYIDGEAERIFNELEYHMPFGCPLKDSQIFGVIDPPRAGVSDKVIIGCRRLKSLFTLCYVSCDPKAATKNLIDLCRPPSRKFDGDPFRIVDIQPVDLFPQTEHVEWVIKMQR